MCDTQDKWDAVDSEYGEFSRIENTRSNRSDLHAFILLDELFPSGKDIIDGAAHDKIFLSLDIEEIETLTLDQILELVRCGVMFYDDYLEMNV